MAKDGPIQVLYPSGARCVIRGKWIGLIPIGEEVVVAILDAIMVSARGMEISDPVNNAILLDPRAVCLYEDFILYEPRRYENELLPKWARDWLTENPDWPRRTGKV